jgi:hypothetical protein
MNYSQQIRQAAKHILLTYVVQWAIIMISGYTAFVMAQHIAARNYVTAGWCFLLIFAGFVLWMRWAGIRDHWARVYYDLKRRSPWR